MCVNIENQRKLGTARPATLAIAYATASIWKSTSLAPGSVATDFNAVYLYTDDVPVASVLIVPPAKQPRGKRVGKKTATAEASTVPSTSANSKTPTVAREDTRKCNYCHKTGHLWRHCPTHNVNSQSPRLEISAKGEFGDLGSVGVSRNATANILSQGQAMQDGASVSYESTTDRYVVQKPNGKVWVFNRKLNPSGRKTNYWVHDTAQTTVLTNAVSENLRRYT